MAGSQTTTTTRCLPTTLYKHLRDNTPEFEQLAAMQAGIGYGSITVRRGASGCVPQSRSGRVRLRKLLSDIRAAGRRRAGC